MILSDHNNTPSLFGIFHQIMVKDSHLAMLQIRIRALELKEGLYEFESLQILETQFMFLLVLQALKGQWPKNKDS